MFRRKRHRRRDDDELVIPVLGADPDLGWQQRMTDRVVDEELLIPPSP